MYEQYYGFTRTPFRLESEPDMFFFGESQKNVLACIKTSLAARKGIITLSGLPGSGKTTVMRRAIEESIVPHTVICRINRARCSNFLDSLKEEILARQKRIDEETSDAVDLSQLVQNAIRERKHYLIVVDESQQLSVSDVDELFKLVSLEKDNRKHFKFLLVSHEPFHEYFDIGKYKNSDELLSTHCLLLPLLNTEILPYIEHRLGNTGWKGDPAFTEDIQSVVFLITQGIPRRINSFFDRLMLFAYFESQHNIDLDFVKRFCRDLLTELDTQSHPDLDSFDLRQALRRERRLFEEAEPENAQGTLSVPEKTKTDSANHIDEPLASDDPEELVTFVASFIKNPERYKNYTDQYYKIPKNLTLLLCLATETDRYIDDITPPSLATYSASEIKTMIAEFIEKMLVTTRKEPSRVLGLDASASEEEINRHFSYMMKLCRSEYVKSDRAELESIIKNAYIKLLSAGVAQGEDNIPVVDDVLTTPISVDETERTGFHSVDKKISELENAKKILNESSSEILPKEESVPDMESEHKSKIWIPISLTGLAAAAAAGYVFFGGSFLQQPGSDNISMQASEPSPQAQQKVVSKPKPEKEYPELKLLTQTDVKKHQEKPTPVERPVVKVAENKVTKQKVPEKKVPEKKVLEKKVLEKKIAATPNKTEKKTKSASKENVATQETTKKDIKPKSEKATVAKKELKSTKVVNKPESKKSEKALATTVIEKKPVEAIKAATVATLVASTAAETQAITKPELEPEDSAKKEETDLVVATSLQQSRKSGLQHPAYLKRLRLNRLVNNFKFAFENGDIEELSSIFMENAITNDGFNREQIAEDYELLFDETDQRSIQIDTIFWNIKDDTATGKAHFTLTTHQINSDQIQRKEGTLSIKVVDSEETKKISELFFLYQFAEAE